MVTINVRILGLGKRVASAFIRNRRDEMFTTLALQVVNDESLYKSKSTVDNYYTALRSFSYFTGTDILLKDITPLLMEHYQQHLKINGICLNTISCYMRSLRTLYNKIIAKKNSSLQSILFAMYMWARQKHKSVRSPIPRYC